MYCLKTNVMDGDMYWTIQSIYLLVLNPHNLIHFRLKKEMVMRVNQVAAEFRKVSNKQMAETTKRTIRENVSINAQLGKMSDKTLELIQVGTNLILSKLN